MSEYKTDDSQLRVVQAQNNEYLVLAPPGCGKTHILAERIRYAHELGVKYEDMLCLTFTNRAAREMKERIHHTIDDHDIERMYVGNIHRFCSRFLLDYALIPAEVSIIDDDDVISIMAQFLDEEEDVLMAINKRRRECFDAMHLAAMMRQIEHCHPKELRVHPECLTKADIQSIKNICDTQRMLFTPSTMSKIYHEARDFQNIVKGMEYPTEWQPALNALLKKMELALFYDEYKRENRLVDFEDLLLITYDSLMAEKELSKTDNFVPFKHYSWCQVDEVQDLNPLQMKIIDLLMIPPTSEGDTSQRTMMFLGDEQQAIFSFMGAKMSTLEQLKNRCNDRMFHLETNHRSPSYLLDVFNTYAHEELKINADLLPSAEMEGIRAGNELSVWCSNTLDGEYSDVAQQASRLLEQYPEETTAVVVLTNHDADTISERMDEMGITHFKVSGTDLFATPEVKLLLSHLSIFANEHNFLAWSRLLKGLHIYERNASARAFVRQLSDRALTPMDLMLRPDSSYIMEFARIYDEEEIVVFDTETTGLNIFDDDILQIAAVKMFRGDLIPGSEFSVYIKTDREIPTMLGNVVNPIIEERKTQVLLSHEEGLQLFLDYIGSDILLGHNADYDYAILNENLKRFLPTCNFDSNSHVYYDSLKLSRLLFPQLHQYKLKYLLETFHLEGENSHLADADVMATCSVVRHCYATCKIIIPLQEKFLSSRTTKEHAIKLREKFLPLYRATLSRLYNRQDFTAETLISDEMRRLYSYLVHEGIIKEVKGIEYVFRYISREMIDPSVDRDLRSQIMNHVLELSTLKESDLYSRHIVDEKIIITTIHKAKGLEFDNVIVFDATDDRYPSFFSLNNPIAMEEDKRKFYVALTRARRRILVTVSALKFGYYNQRIERNITRFMKSIEKFFTTNYVNETSPTIK